MDQDLPDLGPNCLTLMEFLKDFFKKKQQQTTKNKKHAKLPSMQRINLKAPITTAADAGFTQA